MHVGEVIEFDDPAGLGAVRDDETGIEHPFHCTAIADGSRTIEVGARVTFTVVPGHQGHWEAAGLGPA